jgi:DNA-directed RNA polymerase subunit RPC12/RpoP
MPHCIRCTRQMTKAVTDFQVPIAGIEKTSLYLCPKCNNRVLLSDATLIIIRQMANSLAVAIIDHHPKKLNLKKI